MTVAAVILAETPDSALADADGLASVRRITDVAWAGGAVPIVIVAADPDGSVAAALAGAAATLAEPPPPDAGPVAGIRRGVEVAVAAINETDAVIVWPARLAWVGPETVTSLIEAHGTNPDVVLRPSFRGEAGWPVLVPTAAVPALADGAPDDEADGMLRGLSAAGLGVESIELGDPGSVIDRSTPRAELPAYEGPQQPAAGHVHEWGAAIAEGPDDAPLEGPALAPYGQAVASDPDQPG